MDIAKAMTPSDAIRFGQIQADIEVLRCPGLDHDCSVHLHAKARQRLVDSGDAQEVPILRLHVRRVGLVQRVLDGRIVRETPSARW